MLISENIKTQKQIKLFDKKIAQLEQQQYPQQLVDFKTEIKREIKSVLAISNQLAISYN